MAFAGVSATDKDTIGAEFECFDYEGRFDAPAAHDTDYANVWRILLPRCASKISGSIGAPVAHEAYDSRFEAHINTPSSSDMICSVVKCLAVMAPLGQAAAQVPQPLHIASLIVETFLPSSKEIAL